MGQLASGMGRPWGVGEEQLLSICYGGLGSEITPENRKKALLPF